MPSVKSEAKPKTAAPKGEDWEELRITKAANGGFIVHKSMPMKGDKYIPSPKPMAFSNNVEADAYIDECMGIDDGPAETKEEDDEK